MIKYCKVSKEHFIIISGDDSPSKKIADEDYYWILKMNKDFKSKEKEIKWREERALAQVLGVSSPNKQK